MLKVRDIMTPNPLTVTAEAEIAEAIALLLKNDFNGLPVVDAGGQLVGILCQSDLIAQQKKMPMPSLFTLLDGYFSLSSTKHFEKEMKKIAALTVRDAMTADPATVSPETTIEEAATLMVDKSFHSLPVLDDGKLVGIVGKKDILKTLVSHGT
ncbi:MAG: CBS domain-containing protein [Desulfobacterales bacterium]|jgi:CBS domain-containing protein